MPNPAIRDTRSFYLVVGGDCLSVLLNATQNEAFINYKKLVSLNEVLIFFGWPQCSLLSFPPDITVSHSDPACLLRELSDLKRVMLVFFNRMLVWWWSLSLSLSPPPLFPFFL